MCKDGSACRVRCLTHSLSFFLSCESLHHRVLSLCLDGNSDRNFTLQLQLNHLQSPPFTEKERRKRIESTRRLASFVQGDQCVTVGGDKG